MKKCSYCGRENAEDAASCHECGTQEFTTAVTPPETEPQRKHRRSGLLFRLLVSVFVLLAVSGLSLHVAWQSGRDSSAAAREQWRTSYLLREISQCITQYQKQFHSAPNSLAQLLALTNGAAPPPDEYLALDGWKRPFLFTTDGTNCLVTSLGRDGKPGGLGLDCDLTSEHRHPSDCLPTFHQFFFEMLEFRGMIITCILCGGLAFLIAFSSTRMPEPTMPQLVLAGFRLGATILGAVFVAFIISCLHIPSGH